MKSISVPVELLKDFEDYADKGKVAEPYMVEKLRALLDKPCDWCSFCQGRGTVSADHMNMRTCPKCKPAAQNQGEPVAWMACAQLFKTVMGARNYAGSLPITPLFAEQPAPLAVVMPERMKVEPFTTIDRGSKSYKAGYNAAISEVAKLNGLKP